MAFGDADDFLSALPFLVAAGGLLYIATIALGGTALRLHRRRRQREHEAARRATGPTPWNDWLRDINAREERRKARDFEKK